MGPNSTENVLLDELRYPTKHDLVLGRIDPEQGIRRFYFLMIERDLFGTIRGQERIEEYASEDEAGEVSEALVEVKRREGYQDL